MVFGQGKRNQGGKDALGDRMAQRLGQGKPMTIRAAFGQALATGGQDEVGGTQFAPIAAE